MASARPYSMLLPLMVIMICTVCHTSSTSTDPGTQELIERICRQMEEFGFCNKTFNENLESPSANLVDLTRITVEQAVTNATNTHDFILQLLKNVTSAVDKNALIACENSYNIVLKSMQDARVAFNSKDYDSMMISERVTPRAEASCEITFRTPPAPLNPLIDRNRQMRILIAMALVTVHTLVTSPPS